MSYMRSIHDIGFPVSNRYSVLSTSNMADTTANAQHMWRDVQNDIRSEFVKGTVDEKLLVIFDELKFMRHEQIDCNRGMIKLQSQVNHMSEKLGQIIHTTNEQSDFMKMLAYKSIDLEARSRRNNLIFRGFPEYATENCTFVISQFLHRTLEIHPDDVRIERCHRLGNRKFGQIYTKRPIIVNFRDYNAVELILSRARLLKGKQYSIDLDFPKEISEARSRLWPKLKDLKTNDPRSNPRIVYPAKLVANGRVISDEFPDWHQVLRQSRLTPLSRVTKTHRDGAETRSTDHIPPDSQTRFNFQAPAHSPLAHQATRPTEMNSYAHAENNQTPLDLFAQSNSQAPREFVPMTEMSNATVTATPIHELETTVPDHSFAKPSTPYVRDITDEEQTCLKQLECEGKAARMSAIHQKMVSGPGTHVSRSLERSHRRSSSSSPYGRFPKSDCRSTNNKQLVNTDTSDVIADENAPRGDSSIRLDADSVLKDMWDSAQGFPPDVTATRGAGSTSLANASSIKDTGVPFRVSPNGARGLECSHAPVSVEK